MLVHHGQTSSGGEGGGHAGRGYNDACKQTLQANARTHKRRACLPPPSAKKKSCSTRTWHGRRTCQTSGKPARTRYACPLFSGARTQQVLWRRRRKQAIRSHDSGSCRRFFHGQTSTLLRRMVSEKKNIGFHPVSAKSMDRMPFRFIS